MLYTMDETMAALGLGRSTLYELFEAGSLTRVYIGTKPYVSEEEMRRFVATLNTKPTNDHDHDPFVVA